MFTPGGCPFYCVTASSKASSFRALRRTSLPGEATTLPHFIPRSPKRKPTSFCRLDHLTDMNALNNDDLRPLHRALKSGRCCVVRLLFSARTWRKSQHLYQVRVDSDAPGVIRGRSLDHAGYYLRRSPAIGPRSSDGWTRLMAFLRFRHLNVVQLLTRATTTGRHIEILYGVYRHPNMTLQLPLNNECRSRLVKTIDGNHVAYWPPRVTRKPQPQARKRRSRDHLICRFILLFPFLV
jgi:ankyrin repeat protein